jgi:hemoglobin
MPDPPSIYEWAGGREAFERWLNRFYDLVEQDDQIGPLFDGRVTETHRRNVTTWWCEVMGGPADYTAEQGGYEHMLAKHRDLAITAEQRRRFVTLPGGRRRGAAGRPGAPRRDRRLRGVGIATGAPQLAAGRRRRRARAGAPLGLGRGAAVPAVAGPAGATGLSPSAARR